MLGYTLLWYKHTVWYWKSGIQEIGKKTLNSFNTSVIFHFKPSEVKIATAYKQKTGI